MLKSLCKSFKRIDEVPQDKIPQKQTDDYINSALTAGVLLGSSVLAPNHLEMATILSGLSLLYGTFIPASVDRRANVFLSQLTQRINVLEKSNRLDITQLKNDESFKSIMIQSLSIAIKHHQQTKLNALINAVVNCACNINIIEDSRTIYLTYIDELTPTHVKLLKFIRQSDGTEFTDYNGLFLAFSDEASITVPYDIMKLYADELAKKNLVIFSSELEDKTGVKESSHMSFEDKNSNPLMFRITDVGIEFLHFITRSD